LRWSELDSGDKHIHNPQDIPDDYRKRAEITVYAHFEKTERVLSELKAAQEEGL
jgi:hypothetical protein